MISMGIDTKILIHVTRVRLYLTYTQVWIPYNGNVTFLFFTHINYARIIFSNGVSVGSIPFNVWDKPTSNAVEISSNKIPDKTDVV